MFSRLTFGEVGLGHWTYVPSGQIVKLIFTVNIRQRVNPVLPDGNYGNAFIFDYVETSVGKVIEKSLGYTVNLMMRAKKRVDDEYVREMVELLSRNRFGVDSVCTLIITSWSGLGNWLWNWEASSRCPISTGRNCTLILVPSVATSLNVNLAIPLVPLINTCIFSETFPLRCNNIIL